MTEAEATIAGSLTAFQYMLETLYASFLAEAGMSKSEIWVEREAMLRNMEEYSFRGGGEPSADDNLVRQHALARLESMWKAIERRVELLAQAGNQAS